MSSGRRRGAGAGSSRGATTSPHVSGATADGSYQAVDHRFLKLCDDVQRDLRQYGASIRNIKKLSELIGTTRDSNAIRRQLQSAVQNGKQLTKALAANLKTDFPPFVNDADLSRREKQQRRQQHQKYLKDYKDRLAAFQQVVETAASREKSYAQAFRRASSMATTDDEDEEAGLVGARDMQQVEFNEALIEEREENIVEIHQAVTEVNEIFQDLAALVEEQAKDVDTIELNITEGHTRVGKGVEHLDKAASYQQKARRKMVCLFVIVLLIVIALVLGIVLGTKHH